MSFDRELGTLTEIMLLTSIKTQGFATKFALEQMKDSPCNTQEITDYIDRLIKLVSVIDKSNDLDEINEIRHKINSVNKEIEDRIGLLIKVTALLVRL